MPASPAAADADLVFLPLGGCGEIGMNLNLFGYGLPGRRQWLMVDLGVTFQDPEHPGVDVIMPDPAFIAERARDLLGLVLTHGHEDHIGAVPYLWSRFKCPIYATPFTAALVREKLAEAGFARDVPLHVIPLGAKFALGPFAIEYIHLTHSIPEPNALAIRTPLGILMHTGDWKIDPDPLIGQRTDEAVLRGLGEEGVLAMLCDSTNVFTPGEAGSEADVRDSLIALIGGLTGRVAVTCFASNVARVASIIEAATTHERSVVLVGRAMHRIVGAARDCGYLKGLPPLVSEDDAGHLARDNVLYLCTGSQGEPRAALSRIAEGSHRNVGLEAGDTVIFSSRIIPGNEVPIFNLQNRLSARGVRILTEKDHFVHVSGHPCRGELARMYQWIRPRIAIPVHGEMRHLIEHAALARDLQVPEAIVAGNGSLVRLAPGPAGLIDEVPHGRLYLDGDVVAASGDAAFSDRQRVGANGLVMVTVVLDEEGALIADPAIRLVGIAEALRIGKRPLEEALAVEIGRAVDHMKAKEAAEDGPVEETVRRAARSALKRAWSKRPHLEVQILRVD